MKLSIHETEERNFLHVIFPHKNGVDRIKPHGGDIQIRKMVRTENVLLSFIQRRSAVYSNWQQTKGEHDLGPPPVENAHKAKLSR